MRTLKFLLKKEFKQIFRNRILLPMMFVMPMIQLLIFPLVASYEVRNINIAVVDNDFSALSQKLISKIGGSGYFILSDYGNSYKAALKLVEKDQADLILEIPQGFQNNLLRENSQELFVAANAINGVKAGLGGGYLAQIIADFNSDIRVEWTAPQRFNPAPVIEVCSSNWFNPFMKYSVFMVPGILVVLVTMVGVFMATLNIVTEKEKGTIEQINVTPIRKYQFILGKLIPFWVIAMFIFSVGLFVVARLIYGIVPVGSLATLYLFLAVYLAAVLGIGLLISTYSETQQQAMSVAFFFVMIFMLMSGIFTSIDAMPRWAYVIARCSPVTYFVEVIRMIILKGSTLADILHQFLIMIGFALFFNGWAILNYRKTN